jgi:N-methylhydantoinase B
MGASARADGHTLAIFPANGANTPVEIFESDTPLLIEKRELLADSGGTGKHRGGLGRREVIRVPDGEGAPRSPVKLGIQSGRFRYPPEGLFGGKPGATAQFLINGKPGNPYGLTELQPGDIVTMDAAGGGGFGAAFEREVELVGNDVRLGLVTVERAKKDYGVSLDPVTLDVDVAATRKLRQARAAVRPKSPDKRRRR